MRKSVFVLMLVTLFTAACASSNTSQGPAASGRSSSASCDMANPPVQTSGRLTIATDSPAYSPWFRHNDPSNGQGYEAAVAYSVADGLGFTHDQVKWVVEPFNKSYAPGPKDFDFDINQISITPERAQVVTFSDGYYDDQQALIAIKGTPIANATTLAELQQYRFGAQVGTTSLTFINQVIQSTQQPGVYDTTNEAKSALENGQIDGMVLDLPTASYTQYSIHNGALVGRFPPNGEQFGMLFEKGNPLVGCVNQALATLKSDGTLDQLNARWLKNYNDVPVIQ
jgi:polar amino acid transport system substrate-binding protein